MRVLQILHDRERGGIWTLSHMIEAGLSPHRFMFETVYLYPSPGLSGWSKFVCAMRMARRIWRADFDALISYQSTASILVGIVGWLSGCRLRIVHQTCTLSEIPAPLRLIDKLVGSLGLYTVNIANCAATREDYAHHPAAYRRSMIMIEHGMDAPIPARGREETRHRFKLPASAPILLNVGRLSKQKNQELLIRALASLPQAHLVLAGGGGQVNSYRTLAAALGVSDRVHMLGALPPGDIADLFGCADLFVFPSTWETFGLAAVEAAMLGVPMVAADLPALREVLRTDGPGIAVFITAHDLEEWTQAIQAMLTSPPEPQIVAAFAHAIRRKYSRRRMIESYLRLFQEPVRHDRKERPQSSLQATAKEI
jgi:glycosyltransferase involved in cell wall biosynthesis